MSLTIANIQPPENDPYGVLEFISLQIRIRIASKLRVVKSLSVDREPNKVLRIFRVDRKAIQVLQYLQHLKVGSICCRHESKRPPDGYPHICRNHRAVAIGRDLSLPGKKGAQAQPIEISRPRLIPDSLATIMQKSVSDDLITRGNSSPEYRRLRFPIYALFQTGYHATISKSLQVDISEFTSLYKF